MIEPFARNTGGDEASASIDLIAIKEMSSEKTFEEKA